jgi:hypothetical protein
MSRISRNWLWAAIVLGTAAGCGSTRLVDTWMEPNARGASLSRIAVIYMSSNDTTRRIAEDAAAGVLADKLKGALVTPSYQLVQGPDMANQEAIRQQLQKAGFDGTLVMRPAGVSHRVVAEPAFYPTFTGYWGYAYPMAYGPGYLREETTVRLDTRLYSLKDDKLLWAAVSNTADPGSTNNLIHDVAKKVAKALAKNDLVAGLVSPGPGAIASVRW